MVCVDTSFLIALIRRDHDAEKKLEGYIAAEAKLSTTPITACELFKGAYRSGNNENFVRVSKHLTYCSSEYLRSKLSDGTTLPWLAGPPRALSPGCTSAPFPASIGLV